MKNEIIIYNTDDLAEHIEVRIDEETVWLNQQQLAQLFQTDRTSVAKHLQNIYATGELDEAATCAKIAQVQKEGGRTVTRKVLHYNLDAIISVGYRVNSIRGTQFRIWANRVLKSYLLKGYAVNKRMDRLEENVDGLAGRMDYLELQINASLPPKQGVFFDGQVFDAYVFMADLIKRAKRSIYLVDNYVDETVLTLLSKRAKDIKATIYTKTISKQLQLDLKKHNSQYKEIKVVAFKAAHDRFLILDEKDCYHIGASLKDLGKKWFAFSKMEGMTEMILKNLKKVKIDE
jgi:hypothetical protein